MRSPFGRAFAGPRARGLRNPHARTSVQSLTTGLWITGEYRGGGDLYRSVALAVGMARSAGLVVRDSSDMLACAALLFPRQLPRAVARSWGWAPRHRDAVAERRVSDQMA